MNREENLILMYKDLEVLSFDVDFESNRAYLKDKLEHYDKAPYGLREDLENFKEGEYNYAIIKFFNARLIPNQRPHFKEILEATGCKTPLELSFKGHCLSLANHYWVKRPGENLKYDDINFFTNKWDDSFARAVMSEDFEALKHCDLNVPDVTTAGWGAKGWLCEEDGPKLYKLGIDNTHQEEAIAEALASRLARRLFSKEEVLQYELRRFNGHYASVSSPMITVDEELIPLANILDWRLYSLYRNKNTNKDDAKVFYQKIKEYDMPGLYELFIKVACLRDLCFISDLHFHNLSYIKNMKTGEFRPAPIYDLGGAFGSTKSGRSLIEHPSESTFIMIYFLFNDFDPDWDYSWYDPSKLIGFEEELKEYLSKSEFYTPELIEYIIEIYHRQKSSLDDAAKISKKQK